MQWIQDPNQSSVVIYIIQEEKLVDISGTKGGKFKIYEI